jgi:2,4-dienoyl-CoA reductase (NADPH2)
MMLDHVWQPGRIGPLGLPHRLVMGSMHLGLEALEDGGDALAAFYRERAEAGAALIVTGGSAVSRVGAGGRSYGFINEDADAVKLERAAAAVHEAGARILLQLFHAGRYAFERAFGLQPVAPSAVYSSFSRAEPHALTGDEIHETIEDFARAARRARELGFDGVEIMGSEGYLLNQFMAPLTNRRTDEWGGDSERRTRFPLEVARAVREVAESGQAVVYRISGADLVEGGATQDEVMELARQLALSGSVDALNVGVGWHEAKVPTVQGVVPKGAWRPYARAIKQCVEIPVIASNRIDTAELADAVIASGDADFASLARPFLADPQFVRKSRDPGGGRVNRCIACNACIDRSIFDKRVSCLVNPRAGYELELPPRDLGGPPRRIAVIGGGPAGMEAARALACAGHRVTLFEATARLGGQFRLACRIPGKQDFARTIEYFEDALPRLRVTVRLDTRVEDAEALEGFDAAVLATGVVPRMLELPGAELPHVVDYAELLLGSPDPLAGLQAGEPVVIIGAGGIGVDVAHRLADEARATPRPGLVTIMRRGRRVAEGVGPSTRWVVLQALEQAGVQILTEVAYESIEPDGVVIRDDQNGMRRVPARRVVVAAGQLPEDSLAPVLVRAGVPHVLVGGAADARELDAERAFREGAESPMALQRAMGAP